MQGGLSANESERFPEVDFSSSLGKLFQTVLRLREVTAHSQISLLCLVPAFFYPSVLSFSSPGGLPTGFHTGSLWINIVAESWLSPILKT